MLVILFRGERDQYKNVQSWVNAYGLDDKPDIRPYSKIMEKDKTEEQFLVAEQEDEDDDWQEIDEAISLIDCSQAQQVQKEENVKDSQERRRKKIESLEKRIRKLKEESLATSQAIVLDQLYDNPTKMPRKEDASVSSTSQNEIPDPTSKFSPQGQQSNFFPNPLRRHKTISKRILELLCKRFLSYHAYHTHPHYTGPPVTIQQLSAQFDIKPNLINELYKQWQQDHTFYDRIVKHDLYKRAPDKRLTIERLQHVGRLIKENPFLTLNEICVQLNKIEDLKSVKEGERVEITRTAVARLVRMGRYKKKRVRCVPKERNTYKQLERRYEYCAKYVEILKKRAKVYFLDESGFNLFMIREKAWSRPKEELAVNCPISKGKRFSLIAIIEEQGLAHWRIIDGSYRKFEYLDFIRELFEKLYNLQQTQHREHWLILDNCSIHDKEETMKLADRWNVKVMYLPAYSPQLNPIQTWFHELKTKIRKTNYSGERQLLKIMEPMLKSYQDYDFSNYFHGVMKYVEMGLTKQKF